jgi:type I restriction enzyme S subunit
VSESLPTGWSNKTLADVADISMGQSPPGSSYNDSGIGEPFFQGKAEFGARHPTIRKWTTSGTKFAKAGDVLMSVRAPVGPTNIADVDCVIGRGLASIRAVESCVSQNYLIHFLKHVEASIQTRGKGTTFDAISGQQLRETEILLPPLDEQHRIVELLEDHLSRLDAAEAELLRAEQKLRLLRSSSLEAMIPVGATKHTLGELATESRYGTSTKCMELDAGTPVIRIPNLIDGRIDLRDEKRASSRIDLSALMVEEGDVLFVRTNGSKDLIGRTAVVQEGVEASFASYLIRFRFDKSKVRPQWVHNSLGGPTHRQQIQQLAASSAGQFNLGLRKLDSLQISVPSLGIQDKILAELERLQSVEKTAELSISDSKLRLQSVRRSLLNAAFTGQLTNKVTNV